MMQTHTWLVELQVAGELVRLAGLDLEVDDAGGDVLLYHQGLLEDPAASPEDDTLSLQVQLTGIDPEVLDQAVVTVLLHELGTVRELAAEVWTGRVTHVAYAAATDPVELEATATLRAEGLPLPDLAAIVDESTFPAPSTSAGAIVESQRGLFFPLIFGFPGYQEENGAGVPVVPVPLAQFQAAAIADSLVCIADRALVAGTSADTVQLVNLGTAAVGAGADPIEVTETWYVLDDFSGRPRAVADFSNDTVAMPGGTTVRDSDTKFYAGYSPTTGGGAWRSAYDVITGLLREYAFDATDWDRMPDVAACLAGFQVDTWIGEPIESKGEPPAWAWVREVLVPDLPVVVRRSARGLYLQWDRWWATAADAGGFLDAELGEWERISPVERSSGQVANEVTCRFQQLRTDTWAAQRTYTARDGQLTRTFGTSETDTRVLGHPLAAWSQDRYGLHRADPIDLGWCWDATTALKVLQLKLEREALPVRTVTGWVRSGDTLRPGDVRLLTDPELGWVDRVALVAEEPVPELDGALVRFRLPHG